MYATTIHIERPEGTIIATHAQAIFESAADLPQTDELHERDYLTVTLYLLAIPAVGLRRRDVIQDELATDPLTGALARFRVVAVEQFELDHIEARCQQILGT